MRSCVLSFPAKVIQRAMILGAVLTVGSLIAAPVPPTISYTSDPTQVRPLQSVPGAMVSFSSEATGSLPTGALQWLHDDTPLAGQTQPSLTLPAVSASDSGNYRLRITTSDDAVVYSNTATLNVAPLPTSPVDVTFTFSPDPARTVVSAEVAWTFADGSLLANLSFQDGGTATIRLHRDGSIDPTYVFPADAGAVLAGGADGTLITSRWPYRLSSDGSPAALPLPVSFDPTKALEHAVIDRDGRIYVSQSQALARFTADGSLDADFGYAPTTPTAIWDLSIDTEEHVCVFGGQATEIPTTFHPVVFQLAPSGTIDPDFAPTFTSLPYSYATPAMTWDPLSDGRFLFTASGKHQFRVQLFDAAGLAVPGSQLDLLGYSYGYHRILVDPQHLRLYDAFSVSGGELSAYDIGESGLSHVSDFDAGNRAFYQDKGWSIVTTAHLTADGDLLMTGPFQAWDGHPSPFIARLDHTRLQATDAVPATKMILSNATPRQGETVALAADATGTAPLSFTWIALDGQPLSPAPPTGELRFEQITEEQLGRYQVRVTNSFGTTLGPVVEVQPPAGLVPRLANLSARAVPGPGEDVMVAGLTLAGNDSANLIPLLLRGVGPSLGTFGITDNLPNPVLDVYAADQSLVVNNDNWTDGDPDTARDYAQTAGAFPLLEGSLDAALPFASSNSQYTLRLRDATGSPGIGLLEIYHLSPSRESDSRLLNLSFRARAGSNDATATAGFVIDDPAWFGRSARILLRVIGPSLANLGIDHPLTDPVLKLHNAAGKVIRTIDDWSNDTAPAALAATMAQVGAFVLPEGSADAAVVLDLPAGAYTLTATGKDDDTGIVLLEIYLIP